MPPAIMVTIMSSPIEAIPEPMATLQSTGLMVPAAMPMMPAETMPSVSTTSTLTPMTAVTITRRYGMTVTNETSVAPS